MFFKLKKMLYLVFFVFLSFQTQVFAKTTTDSFKRTFIGSYSYVDSNGHYGNFERFTRKGDDEVSYCIEPGVSFSTENYKGYKDLSLKEMAKKVSLSEEELNLISLYAYFGYGYKKHTGDEWIVATQAMIWKALGSDFDFTKAYNKPKEKIKIPSEIKEKMDDLEDLVNEYLEMPSFTSTNPKIAYQQSYDFGKLNGFEVIECNACTYQTTNGHLIVTPTSKQNGKVTLEKSTDNYDGNFVVYHSDNGQNLMTPGNIESLKTSVNFEVISGRLVLKKYDQDNKSCQAKENGSLKGSIYKLYKEDKTFIKDLIIEEDCTATIEDLELGKYYVQEYQPGLNYELDTNTYSFELSMDAPTKEMIVYDKMYLGQIKLIKYDAETNACTPVNSYASLKGAKYGLYTKEGTLLEKLEIQDNCSAISKKNLLLGDYYLQEIVAPKGYQLDPKKYSFSITKDNAEDTLEIKVFDHIIKTKLLIKKNFLYFNTVKAEKGAKFIILDKKSLKVVDQLETLENGFATTTLPYGEYIIKQQSGIVGYRFIEDINFIVDENTDSIVEMELLNEPYRGTLEFIKTDIETGKFLPDVLFEIYNENDECIYQGKTNEEGKIILENLPYGNYYIIEKKALEGYKLFSDRLYFSIQNDHEIVTISMENEKIVEVPETKKNLNIKSYFLFLFLFNLVWRKKW